MNVEDSWCFLFVLGDSVANFGPDMFISLLVWGLGATIQFKPQVNNSNI